jgi:arylsulfatase A-like enzyme
LEETTREIKMNKSRRGFLKTAGLTALASGLGDAAGGAANRRLNLLWIMTDQQPVHMVGAYGKAALKTPHIDRIAAKGARFNQFHIAAFPCSPSRACFLTGRYAHNHGVTTNDVPLAADVTALGDVLKQAGYRTGHIGKWHLGGSMYRDVKGRKPFDGDWRYRRLPNDEGYRYEKVQGGGGDDAPQHGFDYWAGGWKHYRDYLRTVGMGDVVDSGAVGNHNDAPSGAEGTHIYSELGEEHHMASFFAKEAEGFLARQQDVENPFGLVVSFYGPHLPVAPPRPWDTMYALEDVPLPENHRDTLEGKPGRQRANRRCYKYGAWKDEQFRDYVRRYWGYCSYIDHQVGRVLDALEASGKAEDTIVLFTSDHGDMAAAHGFVYKIISGYDELLRVPFVMSCPGVIPAGMTSDAKASSVDVLPTLLDLMDIPQPDGMDGRGFSHLFKEGQATHRDKLVCSAMDSSITLVNHPWKFVLNYNPRDLDELYHLENDPGEMTNLANVPSHAATVDEMSKYILSWLKETGHPYAEVIARKAKRKLADPIDLWPEVTDFKWESGNTFTCRYTWHAVDAPTGEQPFWSFMHFTNPQSGGIVFRDTTWPKPPTTTWKKGQDYDVGTIQLTIPKKVGSGVYDVAIGLYNPEHRSTPGNLLRGQKNRVFVGKLTIEKRDGKIAKVNFKKAM